MMKWIRSILIFYPTWSLSHFLFIPSHFLKRGKIGRFDIVSGGDVRIILKIKRCIYVAGICE